MIENLTQLFVARAAERPDLRIGTLDEQLTLPDALRRAAGGARRLRELGLDDRHRLAIVATSSTDYLVVWMACVLSGVPVALVNPTYPPELLAQMLDNLDPALVFTDLPDHSFAGSRQVLPLADSRDGPMPTRPTPRDRRRPVRPGVVHAHLRHHRRPEVLRADAQLLPAARTRHRRRDGADRRRTGCSPRCRCSTSTRSDTASSARSPPARTR